MGEFFRTMGGYIPMARGLLESQGRWQELLDDLRALAARPRPAEYLVVLGRKS